MAKNNLRGMEWGKNLFKYIQQNHLLGQETGKCAFVGINGPKGIGKRNLIQEICRILERDFLGIDYNKWLQYTDSYSDLYHENNLVYIYDVPMENGCYGNGIDCSLDKIRNETKLKNIIFVFSSNALIGSNTAIRSSFRIFLYGRLSQDEKISYAKMLIELCQTCWSLENIVIPDNVIETIIKYYTKEAGISSLSVLIHDIFEAIYCDHTYDRKKEIVITNEQIVRILGDKKFVFDELIAKKCLQGVGVAWTKWGGVILPIEILLTRGTGQILFSGNIGNIMQESVMTVFSYFKANYKKWGINSRIFIKYDFHINIYEQGIYKDGSSAALAFFVKILCAIKGISFKQSMAFSGEISLEGRVLRVGGLKEKLSTVQEHGINIMVLPKQSWNEYQTLPNKMKEKMSICFIDNVDELKKIIQKEKR